MNKKTVLFIVITLLLIISIPLGLYLIQKTQIFKPRATTNLGGGSPLQSGNVGIGITNPPSSSPTASPIPQKNTCDFIVLYAQGGGSDQPLQVYFEASLISHNGAHITGTDWDLYGFGHWEGLSQFTKGTTVYPKPGIYSVKLRVQDSTGAITEVCSKDVAVPSGYTPTPSPSPTPSPAPTASSGPSSTPTPPHTPVPSSTTPPDDVTSITIGDKLIDPKNPKSITVLASEAGTIYSVTWKTTKGEGFGSFNLVFNPPHPTVNFRILKSELLPNDHIETNFEWNIIPSARFYSIQGLGENDELYLTETINNPSQNSKIINLYSPNFYRIKKFRLRVCLYNCYFSNEILPTLTQPSPTPSATPVPQSSSVPGSSFLPSPINTTSPQSSTNPDNQFQVVSLSINDPNSIIGERIPIDITGKTATKISLRHNPVSNLLKFNLRLRHPDGRDFISPLPQIQFIYKPTGSPEPELTKINLKLDTDQIAKTLSGTIFRLFKFSWTSSQVPGGLTLEYKPAGLNEFFYNQVNSTSSAELRLSADEGFTFRISSCGFDYCEYSNEITVPKKDVPEIIPTIPDGSLPSPISSSNPVATSSPNITPALQAIEIGSQRKKLSQQGQPLSINLQEEASLYNNDYYLTVGVAPNVIQGTSYPKYIIKFIYTPKATPPPSPVSQNSSVYQYFLSSDGQKLYYRKCTFDPNSLTGAVQPCEEWGQSNAPNAPIRSYHVLDLGNGQAAQYTISEDGNVLKYRKCTIDPNSQAGVVQPCNEEGWKEISAPNAPIRSYAVLNLGNGFGTQVVINDEGNKLLYRKCTVDANSAAGVVQPCDEWNEAGNPQGKNNSYSIMNLGNGSVIQLYISFDQTKLNYRKCTLDMNHPSGVAQPCEQWQQSNLPQGTNRSYSTLPVR